MFLATVDAYTMWFDTIVTQFILTEVEQPSSSCLPQCPYVAHVMTNMAPTWYLRTWMGAFNHWCSKPTALFGSWCLILSFGRSV